jgi:putative flippase GtrA
LSLIRDTYLRFRVLIHEVGKFGLVGIASTIITFLIQNALYGHVGPTTSVVTANAIATCFAFVGNRYWAFRHRKTANMGRETVLFVFFNVVGTLFRLFCYRKFVFNEVRVPDQPAEELAAAATIP